MKKEGVWRLESRGSDKTSDIVDKIVGLTVQQI